MPFRSGKRSSGRFLKYSLLFLIVLTGALNGVQAHATITISPVAPHTLTNGVAYYFFHYAGAPWAAPTMDEGFKSYDFRVAQAGDSNFANMILFDISSDKDFGGIEAGKQLVVSFSTGLEQGSEVRPVPIAYSIDRACLDQDNCQHTEALAPGYLFAARYTSGTVLRLGLYLRDLCNAATKLSGNLSAIGCDLDQVEEPSTDAGARPTTFSLNVYIGIVADANAHATSTDSGVETAKLSISLVNQSPVLGCPYKNKIYFPGDSQIYVDPDAFSYASATPATAPASRLIVLGREDAAVATTGSFWSAGNSFVSRMGLGSGPQTITGFNNTTTGTDHQYQVAFGVSDVAGSVSAFPSECVLSGVQTAAVEGFVNKNNCFIATAAHQSSGSPAVGMLRDFRDRWLLGNERGRSFVRWYYSWSPRAADWLEEHPLARPWVLSTLIPVQAIAWLFLHPWLLAAQVLAGAGLLSGAAIIIGREARKV